MAFPLFSHLLAIGALIANAGLASAGGDCSPGQKYDSGVGSCVDCPVNFYQPLGNQTDCWLCPGQEPFRDYTAGTGSLACMRRVKCDPVIRRKDIKITVVTHGTIFDDFWLRVQRASKTAGELLRIDLEFELLGQDSTALQIEALEHAANANPDALIVSLKNEMVGKKVLEIVKAGKAPVFTFNTGYDIAKSWGALAHFGMHEENAGYLSKDAYQKEFDAEDVTTGWTHCLVFEHEQSNKAMQQRKVGFERMCSENGKTVFVATPIDQTSPDLQKMTFKNWFEINMLAGGAQDDIGLAVLFPSSGVASGWTEYLEGGTQETRDAITTRTVVGSCDVNPSVIEGLKGRTNPRFGRKYIHFGVDQQEWMQGFLAVWIAGMIFSIRSFGHFTCSRVPST